MAGRGAGKTRAGSEWIREKVMRGYKRLGMIAPTTSSGREVMVEGSSGLMACCHATDIEKSNKRGMGRPLYEPSKRRLTWANGATATLYSAEEPERLRGPQHDAIWADELASWPRSLHKDSAMVAWDNAMLGLRLGNNPQAMISTTPKPIPIIRELIAQATGGGARCIITAATTYANRAALAATFYSHIITKYEGTRLGRQELMGELIGEVEGALWTRAMIEEARCDKHPDLLRVVVAVDPAVTANPISSLTGIVVAGIGVDGKGYTLADLSGRYSPDTWGRVVVKAYDDHKADRIIAEGNQGGELVRNNINTVRKNMPVRIVHASQSKQARAEPVAALYEQGRIKHCAPFPELEDQLCTWEPLGGDPSPDRLDALVWAFHDLMLKAEEDLPIVAPIIVSQPRYFPGDVTNW
jgi:phage terminase large subunit-like protein